MSATAKTGCRDGLRRHHRARPDWPTIERACMPMSAASCACPSGTATRSSTRASAGPCRHSISPPQYTRKVTRTMGRVAMLATRATEMALQDAAPRRTTPWSAAARWASPMARARAAPMRSAISAPCSPPASVGGINATTYLRMMPHTAAANISVYFGIKGAIDPGEQRLHLRQPEHRLCLRSHPVQSRHAHGGGRRGRALRKRSGGVRHIVRHQHAQRHARRDTRARSIAIVMAW